MRSTICRELKDTNIKVLTIIVVLVTDILILGNSITQPALAFRNVPFGQPFGGPFPYDYCMQHFFGQQNFRNVPFGPPFELPFGAPSPYDYCMQHFFAQHKFRNEPFELPFP
ncbi:MAG TPA: hypothetical protein VEL11_02445 [Candidatus Bathyarchaeia archaeon]|nr:hypothetical protein [Candidatus Bathyarchaeia archaeon]